MTAIPQVTGHDLLSAESNEPRKEKHTRPLSIIQEEKGYQLDPEAASFSYIEKPRAAENEKFEKETAKRTPTPPSRTISPIPRRPFIQELIERLIEVCEKQEGLPPTPPKTPLYETPAQRFQRIHEEYAVLPETPAQRLQRVHEEYAAKNEIRKTNIPGDFVIQKKMSQKERKTAQRLAAANAGL